MFATLSEKQARKLLEDGNIGRLGCVVEDGPYVVPISYFFEDGFIYSHSLPGLKTSALRKNPKACLQVDKIESDLHWQSVLAFGNYEEITAPGERSKVLNKLLSRFPKLTPVESAIASDAGGHVIVVFRIRVERITAMGEE